MASDPVYALTKHAVVGFVRSVAPQLAERGIRIVAVAPGIADTPLLGGAGRGSGRPASRSSGPTRWRGRSCSRPAAGNRRGLGRPARPRAGAVPLPARPRARATRPAGGSGRRRIGSSRSGERASGCSRGCTETMQGGADAFCRTHGSCRSLRHGHVEQPRTHSAALPGCCDARSRSLDGDVLLSLVDAGAGLLDQGQLRRSRPYAGGLRILFRAEWLCRQATDRTAAPGTWSLVKNTGGARTVESAWALHPARDRSSRGALGDGSRCGLRAVRGRPPCRGSHRQPKFDGDRADERLRCRRRS